MVKSVAIGTFDGVHIAHQELIKRADGVVIIERFASTITPGYNKALFTKKETFFYLFDKIKNDTPQDFVNRLKEDFPNLEKIVVGYDFKFGKDKTGSIDTLKTLFSNIEVVKEFKVDGISIHSKLIRQFIVDSKIDKVNNLLGRYYSIKGYQIRGQGLGAKELVPTINLNVTQYTMPRGVFAIRAKIEDKVYKAICFIGNRVTTDNSFSVEFYILEDYKLDFTYLPIEIEFLKFIRENRKFNTLKELKEQIYLDIKEVNNFFKS